MWHVYVAHVFIVNGNVYGFDAELHNKQATEGPEATGGPNFPLPGQGLKWVISF